MEEEGLRETKNTRIYIDRPIEMDYEKFEEGIRKLGEAAWEEIGESRSLVKELVPEYRPEYHL